MYSDPFRPGHHWMEPPLVGERPLETPFFSQVAEFDGLWWFYGGLW